MVVVVVMILVHSCQQKSIGLKFSKSQTEVTCGTVAIIIRVVLLSPYLRIRAVSLSSIHYNQSHCVYINLYCTTHQLGCVHLNSHGTKAPTTVRCSHLNAQYTYVEA